VKHASLLHLSVITRPKRFIKLVQEPSAKFTLEEMGVLKTLTDKLADPSG